MKNNLFTSVFAGLCGLIPLSIVQNTAAGVVLSYNQPVVTIIPGIGDMKSDWNIVVNTKYDLGLCLRFIGSSDPVGAGTWEFSINSDLPKTHAGGELDSYSYFLEFRTPEDPSFSTPVNVLSLSGDVFGNNSTTKGHGTVGTFATYGALSADDNIMQNMGSLDFSVPGLYDIELFAVPCGSGPNAVRLDQVDLTHQVCSVPEPTEFSLGGLGLALLYAVLRSRRTDH